MAWDRKAPVRRGGPARDGKEQEGNKVGLTESCARCLYDRQKKRYPDESYLKEVKRILEEREDEDTSPVLSYRFSQARIARFGKTDGYGPLKKKYNDLVLRMEARLLQEIESSEDPLRQALAFSRVGNYIDYGAMDSVDEATFLGLFSGAGLREEEEKAYRNFTGDCQRAKRFLLLADNCGEIVLDRMLLEQIRRRFPHLKMQVMVRGGEVLNDATCEDARYAGMEQVAEIVSNGAAVAGTVYTMLPEAARKALDEADVVLSKGQGNYESLSGQGRHIFYMFLCKCELFTSRFQVPKLTGMFVEEGRNENT